MGTVWVKELTGGLDTRRLPETSAGGTLLQATNGHITRGGEFESRAAFVATYTVTGTTGLAADANGIFVFGSDAAPTLPTGVSYLRHQVPSNSTLIKVPSYDLFAGKIYSVGEFADGTRAHFYQGIGVTDWYDGRGRAVFSVVGGTASPASTLTDMRIDNVPVINTPVVWATSNSTTATAIANAINTYSSSPDYTAFALNEEVHVSTAMAGASFNGKPIQFTVTNGLGLSPSSGLTITGASDEGTTFQPGQFVRTIQSQMHSLSGPNEHFSAIGDPTRWTTDAVGAGFIDMSSQASGSENLIALAKYQQWVAVFAERIIQIWYFDPDPTNDKQVQVLNNTGTASPRSVTQVGDADLFYLDESGLRSLRARDASSSAATTDIGVPVDSLITAKLASLGVDDRRDIIGVIEPRDGRFWLIIKNVIYVFSYFEGAKVSAWSTYIPTDSVTGNVLTISDAIVFQRRVYLRAGDTIYVYGGIGQTLVYDATQAEVDLPYLDAGAPAKMKQFEGLDIALRGEWQVFASFDVQNQDAVDDVAIVYKTTYGPNKLPMTGTGTHIGLRLKTIGQGPHRLGAIIVHYEGSADDD